MGCLSFQNQISLSLSLNFLEMSSKCSEILQKLLEIEGQINKQRNQKIKKYNTLNGELHLMDENSENKTKEF